VVYGPTKAGGMGFIPLFIVQSTQKVKQILNAYRHNTPLKQIMNTTFQWAQRVAGISHPIFLNTTLAIPSLQKEGWITTLRNFLSQSNIKIYIPNLQGISPQRHHDEVIMDKILSSSQWTNQEIL